MPLRRGGFSCPHEPPNRTKSWCVWVWSYKIPIEGVRTTGNSKIVLFYGVCSFFISLFIIEMLLTSRSKSTISSQVERRDVRIHQRPAIQYVANISYVTNLNILYVSLAFLVTWVGNNSRSDALPPWYDRKHAMWRDAFSFCAFRGASTHVLRERTTTKP